MSRKLADPRDVLRGMPPGSMLHAREKLGGPTWELAWLVHEEDAEIRKLGQPEIEFRAGLMVEPAGGLRVGLVPVMLRVGTGIYESWINESGAEYSLLGMLAAQPRNVIHIMGRATKRDLVVPNRLATFARDALIRIAEIGPWTMADFDSAREQVYARYPNVPALWAALDGSQQQPATGGV